MSERLTPDGWIDRLRTASRARLRVYIGAAPGVGKTCALLEDAHALRADGVDVVVGFVETHQRADTARLIGSLEVVPRRHVAYKEMTLEEMDLDAILARAPQACSSTSWRTPTRPAAATPSATRTSSPSSSTASACSPP